MARAFTSKDAKQLIQAHEELLVQLDFICSFADDSREQLKNAIDDAAQTQKFAAHVEEYLQTGSAPGMEEDARVLVKHLHRYMLASPLSQEAQCIREENGRHISRQIAALKPGTNGLMWLLQGRQRRQSTEAAYEILQQALQSGYHKRIRELTDQTARLDKISADDAWQSSQADRQAYMLALKEISPAVADGSDGVPMVLKVIEVHEEISGRIRTAWEIAEHQKSRIRFAAQQMLMNETVRLLKGVPVEELGRERAGVRFKALREAGFATVASVLYSQVNQLADVYGVSEETAQMLRENSQKYAEHASKGIKIRLTADDRSEAATKLVSAICEYRRRMDAIREIEEVRQKYGPTVSRGLSELRRVGNGVLWALSTPESRERTAGCYKALIQLADSDYPDSVERLLQEMKRRDAFAPEQAWEDFIAHTIVYYTILEEIVPGVLGNPDSVYGLPEELAKEIAAQEYLPQGMNCTLRRYQEWGVKYILHQQRVLLGDEMGLGKTIQAIACMVSRRNAGGTHFLVVCPASVLPNWCKEICKKSDLPVTKIHGNDRKTAFADWLKKGGAAVTTFETTAFLKMEDSFRYDMLIVDEAHYIKNTEARRTVNVRRIGENAERMLFMTGTALENNVDEMIALIRILQPEIASELHNIAFMASAPQFREKVAPVYYRRRREDVLTELPDLIENCEWCMLSEKEEELYEQTVRSKNYADIRRVSWNMENMEESCKAARMKEIIDEAAGDGRKVIVFSFFLDTVAKVQQFLGERCMSPINGSVPPHRRQQIIDEFDSAPAGSVLLAQIQSGGTGLNIQSASVVILCEPQLKPSIENQAISRAYRMGQARNVLVYRLLCEDTLDEKIMELLADKQKVFDEFADTSTAANATALQETEIDAQTLGQLVDEELRRIEEKHTA